jgi:hypothetical protein
MVANEMDHLVAGDDEVRKSFSAHEVALQVVSTAVAIVVKPAPP